MPDRSSKTESLPDAAADLADMMAVLAVRLPMMAMTPTPSNLREMERMVSEKAVAAVEGAVALQLYWARTAASMWAGPPNTDLVSGAIEAFSAPGRRTLRANARRLRKKAAR